MILRATKQKPVERDAVEATDPVLMQRLARGDLGALGELYDRYHAPLRRFIARATRDAEDVDDLVHGTFLAAAKSAERYDGRAVSRPWLIGIAVQLLRRRRQTLGRFLAVLSTLRGTALLSRDPRPALQAKRLTVLMAEVEGLSCAEIATALGVPIGTVWTRLHAARRELRQILDGEGAT